MVSSWSVGSGLATIVKSMLKQRGNTGVDELDLILHALADPSSADDRRAPQQRPGLLETLGRELSGLTYSYMDI
jgi:hypothetical protein